MAEFKNKWVGYVNRGYTSIRQAIITRLKTEAPEITDYSSSNFLIILVEIFAGLTSHLNYYIDQMAREMFLTTARRYSSLIMLSRLVDYRIKASNPATAYLLITSQNNITSDFKIPVGQTFTDSSGNSFITIEDTIWPSGTNQISVLVYQMTLTNEYFAGTTTSELGQVFNLPSDYVHDTASVKIDNQIWTRVNTLGRSTPTDKHFVINISSNKVPYIQFGDNVNGMIPPAGYEVLSTFYTTNGADGNSGAYSITEASPALLPEGAGDITIENPEAASGGSPVEPLDKLRRSIPLSIRTLDRAVTPQDYEDIAELSPGVEHAKVLNDCGKKIKIYIAPSGGGVAQAPLLASTEDYVNARKMITTEVECLPSGESRIYIDATVTAKFRKDKGITLTDIHNALEEAYSFENSSINKPIRVSDIIALIDNLERVDYLTLNHLKLIPYARPLDHNTTLIWNPVVLSPKTKDKWVIDITNSGFRVKKNNSISGTFNYGESFIDNGGSISFTVTQGNYNEGDSWEFITYPQDKDINIDDYTVPVLYVNDQNIEVIEQLSK